MFSARTLLTLSFLLTSVLAGTWKQSDSYVGKEFLSGFNHMTIADPTHGRVYVPLQAFSVCGLIADCIIFQELRQPGDRAEEGHHIY